MNISQALEKFLRKIDSDDSGVDQSQSYVIQGGFSSKDGVPEGFFTKVIGSPFITLGIIDCLMENLVKTRQEVMDKLESVKEQAHILSEVMNNPQAKENLIKALIDKNQLKDLMQKINDPNLTEDDKRDIIKMLADVIKGNNKGSIPKVQSSDDDVADALANKRKVSGSDSNISDKIEKFMRKYGQNMNNDHDLSEDDLLNI